MYQPLKKGSKGNDVKSWQFFLSGQGVANIIADGDFGTKTEKATKDFQKSQLKFESGILDNDTLLAAMTLGFQAIKPDAVIPPASAKFPDRPDFKPLSSSQMEQKFGKIEFKVNPDGSSVTITNNFKNNLVTLVIPQLKKLPPYKTDKITVHSKAANQFKSLFEEWDKAGLIDRLLTYDGSFNPRLIRGSKTTLSTHAYGIAIDFNYPWNKLGAKPATMDEKGCVYELVKIANQLGFYWGGHFTRLDGMHFEVAKII